MTRSLHTPPTEDTLRASINALVDKTFAGGELPETVVMTDGAFDFDDAEVVEIRLIFEVDPTHVPLEKTAALRGNLFDLMARNDDPRIPLVRTIWKRDYDLRP